MGTTWPFGSEEVSIYVEAGLSARQADLDNVLKPLLDTFQGIYEEFNDNKIYFIEAWKTIVPKGDEFLRVRIEPPKSKHTQHCLLYTSPSPRDS